MSPSAARNVGAIAEVWVVAENEFGQSLPSVPQVVQFPLPTDDVG